MARKTRVALERCVEGALHFPVGEPVVAGTS